MAVDAKACPSVVTRAISLASSSVVAASNREMMLEAAGIQTAPAKFGKARHSAFRPG